MARVAAEDPPDETLVHAWRAGDQAAGQRLFTRYFEPVRRHLVNKVDNEDDVAELMQRVFAACIEGKDRIEVPANFRSYLFGIVRHQIFKYWTDRQRKRQQVEIGDCSIAELGAGPSSAVARSDQERRLLEALRQVPLKYQIVLELYYWEELTGRELAEVLGVPEPAARAQLRRAKYAVGKVLRRLERFPQV